ncbi:MAG: AzlD domain-containing protein [Synergistaceae bacterium]|nr:AzlD domain-containing protein [Synergistaceae bacterium]
MNNFRELCIALIAGGVTALLRFLPFIAFRTRCPDFILYLGRVLPYAVMSMLVIYCLKGVNIFAGSHGLPEFIACLVVAALHVWKRNTLLSITLGTVIYMFLIQVVFA